MVEPLLTMSSSLFFAHLTLGLPQAVCLVVASKKSYLLWVSCYSYPFQKTMPSQSSKKAFFFRGGDLVTSILSKPLHLNPVRNLFLWVSCYVYPFHMSEPSQLSFNHTMGFTCGSFRIFFIQQPIGVVVSRF